MNTRIQNYDGVLDLQQLIIIWNKKWWVIGSTTVFSILFAVLAYVMTPVYSAAAVVIPANSGRSSSGVMNSALAQLGGLASLAGVSLSGSGDETTEALAILRSRGFIEKFITEENLMPKLYPKIWDSANKRWLVDDPSKQPSISKAYKSFVEGILTVSQDKKTSLVTIKIVWKDRTEAALWANKLVERINQTMRSRAVENSDASIGYLEKELRSTGVVATQEAINRLIESQIRQRMLANVTPEFAFRVVDSAMPSDPDQPIKPRKAVLMVSGFALGGMIGLILAVVTSRRSLTS
jgi:uncharacterized protein involved in exopolysaccharide biosynthesis